MLVQGLPPDGATSRAVQGHSWTLADFRQARIYNELAWMNAAFYNAHRDPKKPERPGPEPVWEPGGKTPAQKAKAKKKELAAAREGYEDIVSQVAPGRI
ncbi:hypothetical protein [Streptomyces qinglanensis]|uniref:hypothetical protein n=1 Tax=Streptomyces qinglanensis TaxID=943816 RepID=UPI003D710374